MSVTIDPRFSRMLQRQSDNQTFLFPQTIAGLSSGDRAEFIRTQAYALIAEVVEAVDETHWKPWATPPVDGVIVPNKGRYVSELSDVFIFFLNLMLAGDVTVTELCEAVDTKQTKNLTRWLNGYDAKATKCPSCGRAYDDSGVECKPATLETDDGFNPESAWCAQVERYI